MTLAKQFLASLSRRARLLIVDDQPVNIRAVHALFRDDYDVFMAMNGSEAMAVCKSQAPDLILLDVMMAGMDGHEVDHFKRFNDRYGHLEGDQCLKAVAQTLASSLNRPYDTLARYGGEEFACVLPNTPQSGAWHVAQRMIEMVGALGIRHEGSDVMPVVTISVGVATSVPDKPLTSHDLIAHADEALYEAKRQGRARACIWDK